MDERLWFNMRAAIHNDEQRRKILKPYRLAQRLAGLTGKPTGPKIYHQILIWKRAYETLTLLSSIFDMILEKEEPFAQWGMWRRTGLGKSRTCIMCGRVYAGKNVKSKHFSRWNNDVCKRCYEEWKEYVKSDAHARAEWGRIHAARKVVAGRQLTSTIDGDIGN